jgi:hypothetical protein
MPEIIYLEIVDPPKNQAATLLFKVLLLDLMQETLPAPVPVLPGALHAGHAAMVFANAVHVPTDRSWTSTHKKFNFIFRGGLPQTPKIVGLRPP